MRGKREDLTGVRFGRLECLRPTGGFTRGKNPKPSRLWLCRCDCGKEYSTTAYKLRAGLAVSCGCYNREEIREKIGPRKRKAFGESAFRSLFYRYKRGAAERGLPFELTEQQFRVIVVQDCFYCGSCPSTMAGHPKCFGKFIHNGLDRFDNDRGYTIDNSVPCCKHCNYAKRSSTATAFMELAYKIVSNQIKRKESGALYYGPRKIVDIGPISESLRRFICKSLNSVDPKLKDVLDGIAEGKFHAHP